MQNGAIEPRRRQVRTEARFDPRLKTYWVLQGCVVLISTVIGIVLLPVWFVVGPMWARRSYDALVCHLAERSLVVEYGILFRTEKTIPLDKIQDVVLKEGPLLRRLGLAKLDVQTAGGSASSGGAEVALVGVQDVHAFRDRVLDRRDALTDALTEARSMPEAGKEGAGEVLRAIRDSLHRIERLLEGGARPDDGTPDGRTPGGAQR